MPESQEQYAEVFDVSQALQSVGGDVEFLTEVVGLTQAAWPTLLTDIRDGVSRGDLHAVETSARLAKAAARNVSAKRAYECALQLCTIACKGDLQAVRNSTADLEREVEMLRFFLSTLADDLCPS
jgi:hypothetical protein